MAFLGIAVSIRIKRCSGSHLLLRYSSVVVPPLFVCIFAVLGINLGNLSRDHSFFFISFVAFGIYCLLNLTINIRLFFYNDSFVDINGIIGFKCMIAVLYNFSYSSMLLLLH